MARPRRRSGPPSRDRLLAAAAREFAAHGFDGAKVDRIARHAHVNKAMLYYHFANKAALYREILREAFAGVAMAVAAVRESAAPPEEQLRRFIDVIGGISEARPHFPAMWLREMAEGGRHLDDSVVSEIKQVLLTLTAILQAGHKARLFREVAPFLVQMGIVGPLLFFSVTAPIRERFAHLAPFPIAQVTHDDAVRHVQAATLATLQSTGGATQSARRAR